MKVHHITPKTILAAVAVMTVPAVAFAAPAVTGSSTAPHTVSASCPRGWGSLPEANSRMVQSPVTNVRTGPHACFDRIVIDLRGKAPGYDVRYVTAVHQEGSGFVVPLRGGAKLQIVVRAPSYTVPGKTRTELSTVNGYRTFRQVAYAGSFEGQTTIGLGVRARLPFRAYTLAGPGTNTRLVVDVAHRW